MDIENPRLLKIKGILFLFLGLASSTLLWLENTSLKTVVLLALSIWSFCRFYYFAFYVLHNYADPSFRYSGLWNLFCYLIQCPKKRTSHDDNPSS